MPAESQCFGNSLDGHAVGIRFLCAGSQCQVLVQDSRLRHSSVQHWWLAVCLFGPLSFTFQAGSLLPCPCSAGHSPSAACMLRCFRLCHTGTAVVGLAVARILVVSCLLVDCRRAPQPLQPRVAAAARSFPELWRQGYELLVPCDCLRSLLPCSHLHGCGTEAQPGLRLRTTLA
jgi:hypothetical protein